ncbi:MAG: hypothetical protein GXO15_06595 [Crenarchaeota archaeon]|nr:hypothetical protein [Thermoproteota archaeon]
MEALEALAYTVSLAAVAAGSIGAIVARRSIHIVSWLVVAALGVAAVLAMLGYTYVAVFHVVIYIGTAVTLFAVIVMLLGSGSEPRPWMPGRLLLAVMAAAALQAPLLVQGLSGGRPGGVRVSVRDAGEALLSCWLCTILMVIAIATVLVEAVALARSPAASSTRAGGGSMR